MPELTQHTLLMKGGLFGKMFVLLNQLLRSIAASYVDVHKVVIGGIRNLDPYFFYSRLRPPHRRR